MIKATDKVKASMDKKRLEYYKKKLLARREELTKTIARTQEEGRTADDDPTVDLADKAANSYTKEFLFGMTNTDRTVLNMIDAALKRIQADEYGVCANCQEESLYRLPGKNGAGIAAMTGKARWKARVSFGCAQDKFKPATTGPFPKARLLRGTFPL